jgi:hypothetical protein
MWFGFGFGCRYHSIMGAWGAGYDTQTASDIRWVYVVWPRPFNCRDVAAIAGRVHLMISDLGRKGGAWPHTKQHHPVPQGPPFSSIDWPPELHRQSHLNHTASSRPKHTTASRPCCHTAPQDQELTSFPLGAEQHHPIATISTSSPPYSTGVHYVINWHALPFDRPRYHMVVFKGHTVPKACPHIAEVRSFAPSAKHGLVMPRQTVGNKISMH